MENLLRWAPLKVQKTDVRVVAATNVNLLVKVEHGKFERICIIDLVQYPSMFHHLENEEKMLSYFLESLQLTLRKNIK